MGLITCQHSTSIGGFIADAHRCSGRYSRRGSVTPGLRLGESRLARAEERRAVVNLRIALDLVVAAVGSREDELVESMIRRNAAEVPGLGLARDEPVLAAVGAACQRLKSRARKIELVCTCDQI